MIPKVIHLFHNEDFLTNTASYDKLVNRCLATWKHYLPGYELRLWHDGLPEFQVMLGRSCFLREFYEKKIWAIVADYVRAWAVFHCGGIYLDTDVYLFRNLDKFLENDFFTFGMPQEKSPTVAWHVEPAFFGAVKGHRVPQEVLKIYDTGEIYRVPFWLANDVFSMAILRAKENFSDELIRPADMNAYRAGQCGDMICSDLACSQRCVMRDAGITLYPRQMLGQGGAIGQIKDRWILISPPALPQQIDQSPDIFNLENVVAYHVCGNSWKDASPDLDTKHLQGFSRWKARTIGKLRLIPQRIKQVIRKRIKNI
ncbi:MAG: glycosyltransferase family 32 protein [Spirochaetia bacterium]